MAGGLTSWTLLTATAGLLAFLVGFYTLIGRDRKSPYLINSVFAIFIICMVGACIDLLAQIVPKYENKLLLAGASTLLFAVVFTIFRLWTIYVRFAYFIDPGIFGRLKVLPGVLQVRGAWRAIQVFRKDSSRQYEHKPIPLGDDLQKEIATIIENGSSVGVAEGSNVNFQVRDEKDPRSLAMALQHQGQANEILGKLATAFLNKPNHYVQYMTASRHPIEFITHLKQTWSGSTKWEEARTRIVAVDAYTSHFGFLDSINGAKSRDLRSDLSERLLSAAETFAGLHTASSEAFKLVKRGSSNPSMRQPTLVIYEDVYALSDLESVEQYRIFARHVLPSERLWDGMFTVFVETAQREEDWKLVSSYAGMIVDLRAAKGRSA